MLPPFTSGNSLGSGVFSDTNGNVVGNVDRNVASIWSNNPPGNDMRSQHNQEAHRSTWGSYSAAPQHHAAEYQHQSWGYQTAAAMHMRDPGQHSVWGGGSEHDQWKYSRSQAPPPPPSVWQYPSQGQEYHEWGSRAAPAGSPQQPGYYYVPSGRDQREEYPYDMGSRSYMYAPQSHMPYYGAGGNAAVSRAAHHISPSHHEVLPPSANSPKVVSTTATPQPPSRSASGGAASFLFEAAAAAAAAAASGTTSSKPSSPKNGVAVSPADAIPHKKNAVFQNSIIEGAASSPRDESVKMMGRHGAGIQGKSPTMGPNAARPNNHHSRLHGSGAEKAPLMSHSGQGSTITTLMIRNIPNRYMQTELLTEIREAGFDSKFDFFYLPMDHETHANFGYAFINFIDDRSVEPFTKRFNGLKLNRFTSNKIIQIVPAQLQGFQANLQHYCKKAVCTDDNVDYRPLFFVDGKCLEFHRASDFTNAGASPEVAATVGHHMEETANRQAGRHRGGPPGDHRGRNRFQGPRHPK